VIAPHRVRQTHLPPKITGSKIAAHGPLNWPLACHRSPGGRPPPWAGSRRNSTRASTTSRRRRARLLDFDAADDVSLFSGPWAVLDRGDHQVLATERHFEQVSPLLVIGGVPPPLPLFAAGLQ
jgi:hypothetical protein